MKKSKQILASSIIAKQFQEECKRRNIEPFTAEERKQVKKELKEAAKIGNKNVYDEKTLEQLLDIKESLLLTKNIILKDIEDGKDNKENFRLTFTNTYLEIVEKAIERKKDGDETIPNS